MHRERFVTLQGGAPPESTGGVAGVRPGARQRRPYAVVWLPAALVAAGMLLPLAYLLWRAAGSSAELGELLLRPRTLAILARTVLLAVAVTGTCVALALPLAWLTTRTDLPGRRVWSVLTGLPLVVPSYVAGFVVVVALGPRGMLQGLLERLLGVERLPEIYGFPGAWLTLSFLSYPYVLLPLRAALARLDPALVEAAHGLGVGSWATFRRVTLPLLGPAGAGGALLVALYVLSDFGAVSLLRYETFTWAIYVQFQSAFDRTAAAGLSLVLLLLAGGVLMAEARLRGRAQYYQGAGGGARPLAVVRLGRWRWPALAFCTAVVLLALGLPLGVLGFWAIRGVAAGEPLLLLWGAARNSLLVSALAAVATILAALPVAILVVRYPGPWSTLVERLTYVGFALPGIVVALSLVFFASSYGFPLYQTPLLLLFAYGVLFLPAAVGAARASLLQISPRLEEAATSLGKAPLQAFLRVSLPLALPGVLAGAALVFLLTMKELPATLLLSPIGFKTLATATWSAVSEAFFAQAAAPALLLVAASAIPMALLSLREREGPP